MEQNLENSAYRRRIIAEIKANENRERMQESLRDTEVYTGEILPYVEEYLLGKYDINTVTEMPIVSSINLAKKIVDQRGSLYRETPERDFSELTENQEAAVEAIYADMDADTKMMQANRMFELQQRQTHVMLTPVKGQLTLRVLKSHQINVIPSSLNPEEGEIFIISSFNKQDSQLRTTDSNNQNEEIGDEDDYKAATERYVVWSPSYHFVMDGRGSIISEEIDNPIAPLVPVFEISGDKDFEYWKRGGSDLTRFTVEFNGALSSLAQIVHMQGFSQAYLKAPESLMPKSVQIGPNYILELVTSEALEGDVEFGYANTGADLQGAQNNVESLLSMFLSSQGIDPKSVTGNADSSQSFSSGVERLLSMVEKFESSKDSMSMFEKAEQYIYELVKAWHNVLKDTPQLDDKYKAELFSEDQTMSIVYKRPEAIKSDEEILNVIERKLDLGLISRIDAIMELENKSLEEAQERIVELDEMEFNNGQSQGIETDEIQDQPDDQP